MNPIFEEFQGVVNLEGDEELIADTKVVDSCRALVFVDNKLVRGVG